MLSVDGMEKTCLKMHRFYYLNCLVILGWKNALRYLTVMKKTERCLGAGFWIFAKYCFTYVSSVFNGDLLGKQVWTFLA